METLGGHYAWYGVGIALATFGLVGVFIFTLNWSLEGFDWWRPVAVVILAAMIPLGVVMTVRQNWEVSRIICDRQAINYDTDARWSKALGCYLRDESGRYIPVRSYITTRVERGQS